jgi:ParB-like nuclease domain
MSRTVMVPLSKIKDNPWRDRVRNPIDTERVEAIATSIGKTKKYWQGTYGRETAGGIVELAFGHHRLEAAKAEGLKEIPVTIEELTDGEMLVWMAQENVRGELPIVIEAVAAAVKALGEGKIKVEPIPDKTKESIIRCAPSFIAGGSSTSEVDHRYTANSIARFLGYVKKSSNEAKNNVVAALGILERAQIAGAEGGETGKKKTKAMESSLAQLSIDKALQVVSDIRAREVAVKKREVESKQAAAEFDKQQREIQAQRKKVEQEAEENRKKLVANLAKARAAEDKAKVEKIKEQIKEKEEYAVEKALSLEVRAAELDKKVEQRKAQEAAQQKVDAYLPIKREVERILHKLEGDTATTKEALAAEVKALARLSINPTDRERLRQAALNLGTWFCEWVALQFIPPFGPTKKLAEYRVREAENRRAQEAKEERARERAEKKAAKENKIAKPKK